MSLKDYGPPSSLIPFYQDIVMGLDEHTFGVIFFFPPLYCMQIL